MGIILTTEVGHKGILTPGIFILSLYNKLGEILSLFGSLERVQLPEYNLNNSDNQRDETQKTKHGI